MWGLIPAHAGKTTVASGTRSRVAAHPRSRGENRGGGRPLSAMSGSSPLTRGKLGTCEWVARPIGLIPAHAGKTSIGCVPLTIPWAHPRSRGENFPGRTGDDPGAGSSPLTRGKRCDRHGGAGPQRLIPAHAGKTHFSGWSSGRRRAHPRSRGENSTGSWRMRRSQGSSPLTRGKLTLHALDVALLGLIPAHAGKTTLSRGRSGRSAAHPRSRGENVALTDVEELSCGSSPLTRGKRNPLRECHSLVGLIPAHAGKTFGSIRKARSGRGSSPLTRGKHFLTCAFIVQIGQILESLELCASSESYSLMDAYATDAPQDRVRSIGLGLRSSRGAS